MSTLRASCPSSPVKKNAGNIISDNVLSLPWDALFNNVENDFDVADIVADSILKAKDRCQITPFYVQAVIANSSVFLVSNTGSSETLHLTHAGTCWLLGKSGTCALPVADSTVDPCHAVIRCTPESGFFIADVGSQSGTRLNRRRLAPQKRQALRDGDMIELGELVLEFFVDNFDHIKDPLDTCEITYTGYDITYTGLETDPGS